LVAAGRGIFVGPELTIRGREEIWRSAGDYNLLTEPESFFELCAIWKKQSQVEPTVSEFIDVPVAELKSP
jgi:DNA-binding transcriptional LysR family regulator